MTSLATFAAGCFWCVEACFNGLRGIKSVTSGYTGGHTTSPDYKQVCTDTTGHVEAVQINFDPSVLSYSTLLDVFFDLHDPTTLNRQGVDVGTQYRSAIFVHDQSQHQQALQKIKHLQASGRYSQNPIVTQVVQASAFYPAEEYHQRYYDKNPQIKNCSMEFFHKLNDLKAKYPGSFV